MELKNYLVIGLIIIGAVAATAYSVYQYIDSIQKDNQSTRLQNEVIIAQKAAMIKANEVIEIQKKVQETTTKLELANEKINQKANDLIEAQTQISNLQNETLRNVTGYGHAQIIVNLHKGKFVCFIKSNSEYNILQASISIINYSEMLNCKHKVVENRYFFSKECFDANTQLESMATLNPNTYADLPFAPTLKDGLTLYIFKIIASHITTIEYAVLDYNSNSKLFRFSYQIFEVERLNQNYKLLEDKSNGIKEDFWNANFPYKKRMSIEANF